MIDVAINAAKQAGALALKYFKSQPKVFYKPDNTPVTRADREAELLIRKIITKNFPDHGIIGEEFEAINPSALFKWVIDPIDGTKEYIRGIKTWATLLAVLENDIPQVGIAYFPNSDEIFVAQKNKGARLNGKRTKVSKTSKIEFSSMSHGAVNNFDNINKLSQLSKLCGLTQGRRSFSTFGYNLLWTGKIDIVLEPSGGIHDFVVPKIITEEAGGKFSDFSGKDSFSSGNGVSTNGLLHKDVIKILNKNNLSP